MAFSFGFPLQHFEIWKKKKNKKKKSDLSETKITLILNVHTLIPPRKCVFKSTSYAVLYLAVD